MGSGSSVAHRYFRPGRKVTLAPATSAETAAGSTFSQEEEVARSSTGDDDVEPFSFEPEDTDLIQDVNDEMDRSPPAANESTRCNVSSKSRTSLGSTKSGRRRRLSTKPCAWTIMKESTGYVSAKKQTFNR
mmetsp:Transcript_28346/g.47656  ORF Transcript_28346/g.47656 Transcript_28346/m.47656 type:complete len:131 (-) Transcript_28346:598-990(-)